MSKTAIIMRTSSTDQGTFGTMVFGGEVVHTTELPWRNNRRQRSCIPTGEYQCAIVRSPKFGRVYGVLDVKGRSNVLIHAANYGGDVDAGWVTNLQGCIAPCMRIGRLRNSRGAMQQAGLVSRPALQKFMGWADGQPVRLIILGD